MLNLDMACTVGQVNGSLLRFEAPTEAPVVIAVLKVVQSQSKASASDWGDW
jgi:hypothetical protein